MRDNVFIEINDLVTEARNPVSEEIDDQSILEGLQIINREDQKVPKVIEADISDYAEAVDVIREALEFGF